MALSSAGQLRPATLRLVAKHAEVSVMTASRALRNAGHCSERTRRRVLAKANELGYRPDAKVGSLMHYLRMRRKPAFQGEIAALSNLPPESQQFSRQVFLNAKAKAELRGYSLSHYSIEAGGQDAESLGRILASRGVEGLLLLPFHGSARLGPKLGWERYAAVAATASIVEPLVHRVLPDHFSNTMRLCEEAASRGYRRLGLVLDESSDERVNHAFSACVSWFNERRLSARLEPFRVDRPAPEEFSAWLASGKPDLVISLGNERCRQINALLGRRRAGVVPVMNISARPRSVFSGIDERPDLMGSIAVDLIASMLQHGERGLPEHPNTTLVRGVWVEGRG